MRYFKNKYWVFEVNDDLTKYHRIYDLVTKEHFKFPWYDTWLDEWENDIELTKNDLFIELL